jgi:hypothetical protein
MSTAQQEQGISTKAEASTLLRQARSPRTVIQLPVWQDSLVSADVMEMFSRVSSLTCKAINVMGPSFLIPAWVLSEVAQRELVWVKTTRQLSNSVECDGIHRVARVDDQKPVSEGTHWGKACPSSR